MKREEIITELRNRKCRITHQRELLIDIILRQKDINCKEIHFQALKEDPNIGIATVYRMVQTLEEIGAIKRESTRWMGQEEYTEITDCLLKLDGNKTLHLDKRQLKTLIQNGIEGLGYGGQGSIEGVLVKCKNSVGGEK